MIKRLVLKNYRVYDHLDMDFGDLEVIKGRNGIGKTSIVEAIGFALFGSALQRGKAGSWIKEGENDGSVRLYLDDFVVDRSNSLALVSTTGGHIVARNNTGIVQWVEKEYGLTVDLFKTSFYIGQKDIGAFAALGPLERTKRVEKLLRIDKLDEYKNTAKAKARLVSSNLDTYTSKLENATYNETIHQERLAASVNLEIELSEEENKLEKLLVAEGAYKVELEQWTQKVKLQNLYHGVSYNMDNMEREYTAMLERNAKVEGINKLINEKRNLVKKLSSVNVLEKYFKYTIREIMDHEKALKTYILLNNEYDSLDCKPIERDITVRKDALKDKQKIYDLNIKIPDTCPTCKQSWPEKATVDLHTLAEEMQAMEEDLEQSQREQRAFEISQIIILPEMNAEQIKEAFTALDNKVEYNRLKELVATPTELKDVENFKWDIKFCRQQTIIADKLDEMRDVMPPTVVDLQPTRQVIRILKQELATAEGVIHRESTNKAIQEEYASLRDEAEELLSVLKAFIKFVDVYRKAFGNNIIPLIQANVAKTVEYLSEGKYTSIKINPDYGIDNFEFYSGSEQDSINFALRLAIAQVSRLGTFNTMILDEIAASFDVEREALLMDILKQQSNQLIYITHGEID